MTGATSSTRMPALDGLRGLAVLLVLFQHARLLPATGDIGAVGVAIFFALSGFLITRILLATGSGGRVDLRSFYLRRARRLFPALAALLTAEALFIWCVKPGDPSQFLPLAPIVLYVQNWWVLDHPYIAGHTWSLSVEEQFYLLWPLAFVAVARLKPADPKRTIRQVALGLVAASLLVRVALTISGADLLRIYVGTDTASVGLLLGCVAATLSIRHGMRHLELAGWAALIVSCVLARSTAMADIVVPVTAPAAACALLLAYTGRYASPFSRAISARWLQRVGRRSYAVYLWHVLWFSFAGVFGLGWLGTLAALGLTWVTAEASWRYVEEPFLRQRVVVLAVAQTRHASS